MKIKYTGVKEDGETAFSLETGITWFPGMEEEVSTAMAAKMLQHPDVFTRAEEGAAQTITLASAASVKAAPLPTVAAPVEPGVLLGSDVLPANVDVGGQTVSLGTIVASAHASSGLTVDAWNALGQLERDELLAVEVGLLRMDAAANDARTTIQLPDGTCQALGGLTLEDLHALAKELDVKVHFKSGIPKVTEALLAAYPVKK